MNLGFVTVFCRQFFPQSIVISYVLSKLAIKITLTWYEFDIIAMSMLSSTIRLQTEYDPNISKAQKRVNSLIPVSSKSVNDTKPKDAQNRDWDVSNKLAKRRQIMQALPWKIYKIPRLFWNDPAIGKN